MKSYFASPERAPMEIVRKDGCKVASSGEILDIFPAPVLILNEHRQVVFINLPGKQMLGQCDDELILGKRPGELLGCVHSSDTPYGCGTSKHCSVCGAVQTVLKAQNSGKKQVGDCRILTEGNVPLDLRICATPHHAFGKKFTIVTIQDITAEMRLKRIEKTFLHDITNILCVLKGNTQLLHLLSTRDPQIESCYQSLTLACDHLMDEIRFHHKILKAEEGSLVSEFQTFQSKELFRDLISVFSGLLLKNKKNIQLSSDAENFKIRTDHVILSRILYNMLKNAIESSNDPVNVTCDCRELVDEWVFSIHNPSYMNEDVQMQIFQRSFSTKGKGRGIGTYSMKLFAEKYLGGKVWFTSSQTDGTVFYVSVPHTHPNILN